MKCFNNRVEDGSDDDFDEEVCPNCGVAGGIEASDDGNRDQSCGTCGKVLLIDGKKPVETLPDEKQFRKLFPNVDPKNVKEEGMFKGSGLRFVDKTTGNTYAYNGGEWRQKYTIC